MRTLTERTAEGAEFRCADTADTFDVIAQDPGSSPEVQAAAERAAEALRVAERACAEVFDAARRERLKKE